MFQDSEFAHMVGAARIYLYPVDLIRERDRYNWSRLRCHALWLLPSVALIFFAIYVDDWRSVLLFLAALLAFGVYRIFHSANIGFFAKLGKWEQSILSRERRCEQLQDTIKEFVRRGSDAAQVIREAASQCEKCGLLGTSAQLTRTAESLSALLLPART